MLTSDRPNSKTIITLGLGYLMKLFATYFLTGMVILTLAALLIPYITFIGPEMPFLKYFSFMLPIDENGIRSIDESDLMRIYNFIVWVLFLLSIIGRWMMLSAKKLLRTSDDDNRQVEDESPNRDTFWQIKRRFFINGIIITGIYIVSFFAIPFANMAEGTTLLIPYMILVVFYLFSMTSNVLYVVINNVSISILETALYSRK